MANVLEFALGLETGGFVTKVVSAEAVLGGLRKMAEGIEFVFHKMEQGIERAAGLEAMHKRTGESVGTLYQLQEAFKTVGLSADQVPTMILRIQRSLSGVNEMGQSTSMVFSRLGLDIRKLKNQDAAMQLNSIAGALAKLPKEQATGIASQLFGRFAMGDILQIARSQDVLKETLAATAREAILYEAVAVKAEKIRQTWVSVTRELNVMWTEIAAGIMPVLQKVEDKIKAMPWEEWGRKIGSFLSALEKGFETGNLSQMLTLAIEVGFGEAEPYVVAFAKGMGASILEVMKDVATVLGELFGSEIVNRVVNNAKMIGPKLAAATANKNIESYSNQALAAEKSGDYDQAKWYRHLVTINMQARDAAIAEMDAIEKDFQGTRDQIIKDAMGKINSRDIAGAFTKNFQPGPVSPETTLAKLRLNRLLDLAELDYNTIMASTLGNSAGGSGGSDKRGARREGQQNAWDPEKQGNVLEKMGFVMGGSTQIAEWLRRTAFAAEQLVEFKRQTRMKPGWSDNNLINQV